MNLTNWLNNSATLCSPPPGSINVLVGKKSRVPAENGFLVPQKLPMDLTTQVSFKLALAKDKSTRQACLFFARTKLFHVRQSLHPQQRHKQNVKKNSAPAGAVLQI